MIHLELAMTFMIPFFAFSDARDRQCANGNATMYDGEF